MVKGEGELK